MPHRVAAHRAVAASQQLIQVHQALRERLAALRQLAAASGGTTSGTDSFTGPVTGSVAGPVAGPVAGSGDLLSHCLSFCTAIGTHHTGEDAQLFPALRAAAPELAPVVDKLIEDHTLVAGILREIQALLAAPADPETLRRELDGLTAILESHFSFEERRIAAALDTLGPEARFPAVFTADGS